MFAQQMPSGWHKPPASSTQQGFRRKDPHRFLLAVGDFNGDGVKDEALLLVNDKRTKLGLFVCLKTAQECNWQLLEEMDVAFLDVMGVAAARPGKYQTACGKGYWECEKGEPETLVIRHAAIEFFKDESASSYYVYKPKSKTFQQIAISD